MKHLVIVAPTLNEGENIESFITSVLAQQIRLENISLSLLISDSNSKDKTGEIVKRFARKNSSVKYLNVEKRGLGFALTMGLNHATQKLGADYLLTMEADLSNDPNQIPAFVDRLQKSELVIGSRYVQGGRIVNWSYWRKTISLLANKLLKLFAWTKKTNEFTNLYRAFTADHWRMICPMVEGHTDWIFVPAFIFQSLDKRARTSELPIIYYDRFGGRSKMRTISYTKNLLLYAFKFRANKIWNIF